MWGGMLPVIKLETKANNRLTSEFLTLNHDGVHTQECVNDSPGCQTKRNEPTFGKRTLNDTSTTRTVASSTSISNPTPLFTSFTSDPYHETLTTAPPSPSSPSLTTSPSPEPSTPS